MNKIQLIQKSEGSRKNRWFLLVHQLPPKPNYLRVKIWRRLQQLGSVAIKNSVYVLPKSDASQEAFQWVMREITAGGGEASLCEAQFVEGLRDDQVEALFKSARAAEYAQVAEEARRLTKGEAINALARLKRRLAAIRATDFFGAPGRETAESLLRSVESRIRLKETPPQPLKKTAIDLKRMRNRTWVTRRNVYVDRMASAWLIRKFVDPQAKFKFVEGKTYPLRSKEIRFDMFEAEFTHEGDRCTFEVLMERTHLNDRALREIAEVVHEIDLKDGKFLREDAAGTEHLFAGIVKAHKSDEVRLARSAAILDDLHAYFRKE